MSYASRAPIMLPVLPVVLTVAFCCCTPKKEAPPEGGGQAQAEGGGQQLAKMFATLAAGWETARAATPLTSEAVRTWIPDVGVRGRYQIAKRVIGVSTPV